VLLDGAETSVATRTASDGFGSDPCDYAAELAGDTISSVRPALRRLRLLGREAMDLGRLPHRGSRRRPFHGEG
jgi:hypothetical protein